MFASYKLLKRRFAKMYDFFLRKMSYNEISNKYYRKTNIYIFRLIYKEDLKDRFVKTSYVELLRYLLQLLSFVLRINKKFNRNLISTTQFISNATTLCIFR